jgi:hypothetical protein
LDRCFVYHTNNVLGTTYGEILDVTKMIQREQKAGAVRGFTCR